MLLHSLRAKQPQTGLTGHRILPFCFPFRTSARPRVPHCRIYFCLPPPLTLRRLVVAAAPTLGAGVFAGDHNLTGILIPSIPSVLLEAEPCPFAGSAPDAHNAWFPVLITFYTMFG